MYAAWLGHERSMAGPCTCSACVGRSSTCRPSTRIRCLLIRRTTTTRHMTSCPSYHVIPHHILSLGTSTPGCSISPTTPSSRPRPTWSETPRPSRNVRTRSPLPYGRGHPSPASRQGHTQKNPHTDAVTPPRRSPQDPPKNPQEKTTAQHTDTRTPSSSSSPHMHAYRTGSFGGLMRRTSPGRFALYHMTHHRSTVDPRHREQYLEKRDGDPAAELPGRSV